MTLCFGHPPLVAPGRVILSALALSLISGTLPAQTAPRTGRIEGIAVLAARLTNQHRRVRIYSEPGASETTPRAAENPLENVVLYLEGNGVNLPAAPQHPAMRQSGEQFAPHVLPIVAGNSVAFPNEDPIYHNVFSLSRVKSFDLGRFGKGQSRSVLFPKAGIIQVFCHIHADMSGYILVLNTGFFTKPDSAGHFAIEGIPEGNYQMIAWHERIRPISMPVQVVAGQTTQISVSIPLLSAADST